MTKPSRNGTPAPASRAQWHVGFVRWRKARQVGGWVAVCRAPDWWTCTVNLVLASWGLLGCEYRVTAESEQESRELLG